MIDFMQYFSYLDEADLAYVHDSSLEILEEVGLIVRGLDIGHQPRIDLYALIEPFDELRNELGRDRGVRRFARHAAANGNAVVSHGKFHHQEARFAARGYLAIAWRLNYNRGQHPP